jgi:plastocyanin
MMRDSTRRRVLAGLGAAATGALAGCSDDGPDGDVQVGPGGANAFDPEEHTASVGETVTWVFASPNHNVSGVPDHSPRTSLPDGAEPFASYGVDGSPNETAEQGSTFEHTFETPGEYTCVCIPHVRQGMIGTVVVEE